MTNPHRGLTILSTSAGSGKSLLTRSLTHLQRIVDESVTVYKPVVLTLKPHETASGEIVDLSAYLSSLAAGLPAPRSSDTCSYIAQPRSGAAADLLHAETGEVLRERVGLLSEDGLDYQSLPDETWSRVLDTCAAALAARAGRYLITEGSGGAVDSPTRDLSNTVVPVMAQRPIVLVAGARRGGAVPGLLGTVELMTPAVRSLLHGFVINMTPSATAGDQQASRAESLTGLPCLGVLPEVPLYAGLPDRGVADPTASDWMAEITQVAEFLKPHLHEDLRGGPAR